MRRIPGRAGGVKVGILGIVRSRSWATLHILSEVVSYLDSRPRQLCSWLRHVPNIVPPVCLVIIPQHSGLAGTSEVIVEAS